MRALTAVKPEGSMFSADEIHLVNLFRMMSDRSRRTAIMDAEYMADKWARPIMPSFRLINGGAA